MWSQTVLLRTFRDVIPCSVRSTSDSARAGNISSMGILTGSMQNNGGSLFSFLDSTIPVTNYRHLEFNDLFFILAEPSFVLSSNRPSVVAG